MFVLSEQQVSFILNDIRRNGIELEELQLNLLDHICCIVENEMRSDQNFEEFYRSIIPRFFKRELREIQEETDLLLTFKNYYTMKKVMIISGTISAIAVVFGSIFKIQHWPGASVMFLLAVLLLSFVFLPLLFLIKAKEVKVKQQKITLGIATIFGIIVSLATLFKVMHWPFANILWLVSLGILFFLFLPIYFFGGIRNPETKMNTIVSTILILFAGGMLFLLTNLKSARQYNYLYFSSTENIGRSYAFATEQNNLKIAIYTKDSLKSKTDYNALKNSCDELCNKIEATKNQIIEFASSGRDPKPTFENLLADYAGNYDLPTSQLFGENEEPKTQLAEIRIGIDNLKKLVKEKYGIENISTLNTDDVNKYGNADLGKTTWEKGAFFHVPFELVMINLSQLQLDIRTLESSCL
ncbi:MAG: hypothetical protein NT084_09020 [Bacteroidetes bacterium]|nr:hypothetical protein [Bacteroidota bacterium]